jgi:peptidoglycan/xylan/chitin deacetylase (PgdA/CDA1 family)
MVPLGNEGPYVSVTFDDFPRSAYTVGGSILKNYGVRGTYYVAMGLMNTSNALGDQFRMEDLRSAANEGHELASHTYSHQSSRAVSCAAFRDDVRKGWSAIREIGGQAPTRNFAFPYGKVTLSAKRAVGKEMMSCRGTYGGVNGPYVDLNLLLANSLHGDPDDLDGIAQLIRENEKRKGWLIFYTHDVSPAPSRYGCSPRFLDSTVRMAAQSGAKILPVGGVLARIL